jgi:hypothetical protein
MNFFLWSEKTIMVPFAVSLSVSASSEKMALFLCHHSRYSSFVRRPGSQLCCGMVVVLVWTILNL